MNIKNKFICLILVTSGLYCGLFLFNSLLFNYLKEIDSQRSSALELINDYVKINSLGKNLILRSLRESHERFIPAVFEFDIKFNKYINSEKVNSLVNRSTLEYLSLYWEKSKSKVETIDDIIQNQLIPLIQSDPSISEYAFTVSESFIVNPIKAEKNDFLNSQIHLYRTIEDFLYSEQFYNGLEGLVEDITKKLESEEKTINIVVFIAISLLIILSTIISIVFAKWVVKKIVTLENNMKYVAKGDFTRKFEFDSKDEFGLLALHFNEFIEDLRENVESINKAMEQASMEISKSPSLVDAYKSIVKTLKTHSAADSSMLVRLNNEGHRYVILAQTGDLIYPVYCKDTYNFGGDTKQQWCDNASSEIFSELIEKKLAELFLRPGTFPKDPLASFIVVKHTESKSHTDFLMVSAVEEMLTDLDLTKIKIFSQHTSLTLESKERFEQIIKTKENEEKTKIELINTQKQAEIERNKILEEAIEKVELLVEQKTREISTILKNIKQGIFLILKDQTIESHYSSYLEDIVNQDSLAGRDPIDVLFKYSRMSQDELSMLESCLLSTLGESEICFQLNREHLPSEINYQRKILELDWQSVSDGQGNIEKILVVVRDVTELRKLENESKSRKEEMAIIEELIGIRKSRCDSFFSESKKLIEHNYQLLEDSANFDEKVLRNIFINYHTVKGNARAIKFKFIVDCLHNAESICSEMEGNQKLWNRARLIEINDAVYSVLIKYLEISSEKLGRIPSDKGVPLDLESIEMGLQISREVSSEIKAKYHSFWDQLFSRYYRGSEDVFNDVFAQVAVLSKDLNKENPKINITGPRVDFSPAGCELINNVFTHLVRNAMDHGIETREVRLSKSKSSKGNLNLKIDPRGDRLFIIFSDDGTGLNLSKIKKIGVEKKLIHKNEDNPQKIAELIFEPGFSTSAKVSDVSGRGMGMDAVKTFAKNSGGDLSLIILDKVDSIEKSVAVEFSLILVSDLFFVDELALVSNS